MPTDQPDPFGQTQLLLWKWADNDEWGGVLPIVYLLSESQPHPALQPFDPSDLIRDMEKVAAEWRAARLGLIGHRRRIQSADKAVAVEVRVLATELTASIAEIAKLADRLGLSGCDLKTGELLPQCRPKRHVLRLDRERVDSLPQYDPDLPTVLCALGAVDVRKRVCFAVLEAASGDYVQTYGCDGKYHVEWREYHDRAQNTFAHFAAGLPNPSTEMIWLGDSKHHVAAFTHEILSRPEVEHIFAAFHAGEPRPNTYAWRPLTHLFNTLPPQDPR